MLSRKIEKDIINWLENENKALLIDGARQVGKTYIIRKVLNEKNFSYNEFNLLETPEIVELLKTTHSVDELITNLSLFAENPFVKGKTVIFFGVFVAAICTYFKVVSLGSVYYSFGEQVTANVYKSLHFISSNRFCFLGRRRFPQSFRGVSVPRRLFSPPREWRIRPPSCASILCTCTFRCSRKTHAR